MSDEKKDPKNWSYLTSDTDWFLPEEVFAGFSSWEDIDRFLGISEDVQEPSIPKVYAIVSDDPLDDIVSIFSSRAHAELECARMNAMEPGGPYVVKEATFKAEGWRGVFGGPKGDG